MQHSNFRARPTINPCSEARGKQLASEANAPVWNSGSHGLRDKMLLVSQPRQFPVVVRAHRPAHGNYGIEVTPIRHCSAFVELHTNDVHATLAKDVLVSSWRLAIDVLKHQEAHRRSPVFEECGCRSRLRTGRSSVYASILQYLDQLDRFRDAAEVALHRVSLLPLLFHNASFCESAG